MSWFGILHIYNIWNPVIRIAIYLVVRNFIFVDFLAVKFNGSNIKQGICLVTPRCFNIQTSHGFENFCLFSSNSTYSVQNQVIYFQYVYNCVQHRFLVHSNTDSWFDVTSVNFNSQKVHEDKIFERQNILQFLSRGYKYYKYVKYLIMT